MQTVCLVGKPNVGKSSIFNRLIKENKSIIMDTPGVTRDRIYGRVNHNDKSFYLIDTGGISLGEDDFAKDILVQATLAIDEADLVLFVVDGNDDPDASDKKVAEILHKSSKKVIVVVNKIDNDKKKENLYNYYELGFSDLVAVSASHNIGFDGLLNTITSDLPEEVREEDSSLKFCIIGRPNVGKSSILNAMLEEDKAIVTDIEGTTRDIVEGKINIGGFILNMIDTAGIRKTEDIVEKIGVNKSLELIENSDLILYVLNNNEELKQEDLELIQKLKNKNHIIIINKVDLENKLDTSLLNSEYVIKMSIKENKGLEELKQMIKDIFNLEKIELSDMTYVTSARSIAILKQIKESINDIETSIKNNLPIDIIEIDIKNIWDKLGEIIGVSYENELIDVLFSQFCLGK